MKSVVRYISEIIFAIVLIFVSYFVWDRIDVNAYENEISKYNLNDIGIEVDNDFSEIVYLSEENVVEDSILYVNNYQNKIYSTNIFLVLNGFDINNLDSFYLSINDEIYSLNDIFVSNKDNSFYFLIDNLNLNKYEKTSYTLKLLVDDNFDFSEFTGFSYKIEEEII